jgi:hypothetical protein
MSRTVLFASAALAAFFVASPAAAHDSWGRPNVGFTEYRADADQCSNAAFDAKLWYQPVYHLIRLGYGMSMDVYTYGHALDAVQHAVTATIADQLQNAVDRCLIDRGYTRFHLTEAQERQLGRFHRGTEERAHFLHSLAADPRVMAAQATRTVRPPEGPADEGTPRNEPPPIIDLGPRPI